MFKKKKKVLDVIELTDEMTFTFEDIIFIVNDVHELSEGQNLLDLLPDKVSKYVSMSVRKVMEHKEIESRIDGFIEAQIDMRKYGK